MFHFNYYAPTQVVFGKDTEEKTGELVKAQNCKKVLIHYGSGSVKRTGLLDRVKQALEKENLAYTELGGVVPNPRLSLVKEGIELCKKKVLILSWQSAEEVSLTLQRQSDMELQMVVMYGIFILIKEVRQAVCQSVLF